MKILLIGAERQTRESRLQLLRSNGFEAEGVGPEDVTKLIVDPRFECLVLGASLGEKQAAQFGYDFSCGGRRYVIRVAEHPIATDYPYADMVVNPGNPNALLGAVKALCLRCEKHA